MTLLRPPFIQEGQEDRERNGWMILSTGMRTDIPAYFSKWLINRIREGYLLTRNPYNQLQVTRHRLDPEVVDILCFGTKNSGPLIPHPDELRKFRTFWFVTMNPYGRELEPHVPYWKKVAEYIGVLSETFGRRAVSWRVSPVIVNGRYTVSWHIERFAEMAEAKAGKLGSDIQRGKEEFSGSGRGHLGKRHRRLQYLPARLQVRLRQF